MKPWVKTGIFFAIWMFIFMTFIAPYLLVWIGLEDENEPKFPIAKLIISAIVYTIAGMFIGYINRNNKKIKKQIDS